MTDNPKTLNEMCDEERDSRIKACAQAAIDTAELDAQDGHHPLGPNIKSVLYSALSGLLEEMEERYELVPRRK